MYRLRQFILVTQWLAHCKFAYKGDNYKKKSRKHLANRRTPTSDLV
ncbi:hypothetical protein Goshw_027806 [Gossypium schwendimanii]|uniref:Uncharacterized protein n=1 Tax=Gossypium schwendimanii TaxID=34291 RepID=A0A7J9LZ34_GOSSC|nr:hypothetical protein [Gossypium schwendimanii]